MVAAAFKMLYFVILANYIQIIQVYSVVRSRKSNLVSQNNLIFFSKIILMILWNHFSTVFWYKIYNIAGTHLACNL